MKSFLRHAAIAVVLAGVAVLIVRSQRPPPPEPPAIELHRSANASFFEPAKRKVLFVLIIGSDVREGNPSGGRADTLQLLAVNTRSGAGTIVGIPRDSYVPIPGSGTNKINSSLFFGGPQRTVQTVERLAGVNIHYYAMVEFSRFRRLVDLLGGVEVKVPYAMNDSASGAFFKPGPKKMNGAEALAFSRARKTVPGGDFGRSANQGRLLVAALQKFQVDAKRPLSVAKYIRAFDSLVASDVPAAEFLDLVAIGRRLKPSKIRSVVLPGSGGNAGGASVVFLSGGANDIFKKIRTDAVL
jgi:LCP family protein required for cell wall assembly